MHNQGEEGFGFGAGILDESVENQQFALGGCGIGCLFCVVTFAVYSLGAVEPLTYGIRYNYFNKYADVYQVYGPGRHFIGPWSAFLLFPASVQTVEFTNEPRLVQSGVRYPALHTRTKEGLALHLQVSLQYQLIQENVGDLYSEFNQQYEQMYIATIRDTLIRAAADYEAWQLWTERKDVGERMQEMVNGELKRVYATCWGLQLMVIELPQKFDLAIVATQVQNQRIATKKFEQQATTIRARTKVIAAEFDKKVAIIKASGKANYTLKTKLAKANAKQKVLQAEAAMMEIVKGGLTLEGQDLVEYQQFSAVSMMSNATVFYGFAEGTQVLMQQTQDPVPLSRPLPTSDTALSAGGEATGVTQAAGTRRLSEEL